jgi:hypothetical protein
VQTVYSCRSAFLGSTREARRAGSQAASRALLVSAEASDVPHLDRVDTILIRPMPYADADRLVMVWDDMSKSEGDPRFFSTSAEWTEWRRLNTVFTDLACSQPGTAILSGDTEPEEVQARRVTWNLWNVLGVQPVLGRVFTEDEDNQGSRVVVLSHGLWHRRFGGEPDVVGRKLSINDETHEVIGVMPQSFYFMPLRDIDVWMPASITCGRGQRIFCES